MIEWTIVLPDSFVYSEFNLWRSLLTIHIVLCYGFVRRL